MGLKEQALAIQPKLAAVEAKCYEIAELLETVLMERKINDKTVMFSMEDKQVAIDSYKTKKTELKTLVEELP